ncbi:MAG: hypothetical protein H6607_00020 [Flavobacteriales bacterium]|nr:hypothetical protein [Flavobacteriales bacterium]
MEKNNILLEKLDAFIRKYYKNQLVRGILWVTAGIISAFLVASLFEYFGHFNSKIRTAIFGVFTIFSAVILVKFVIIPLLKLNKLGKTLDYNQAATIVGQHFSAIGDKLINTLQLGANADDDSLLRAAIEQKTAELKPIPFHQAIDINANKKYIKYALIPVLLFVLMSVVNKGFNDSANRLMHYNKTFEREAPFEFVLDMDNLTVLQNSEVEIKLKTIGSQVPGEVYLNLDGNKFKMTNQQIGHFTYTIKKVGKTMDFHFLADDFESNTYTLKTLSKPTLVGYETFMDYPEYTGLKDEWIKNTSEVTVPVGTQIKWKINAKNAEEAIFDFDGKSTKIKPSAGRFEFAQRILKSNRFNIKTSNTDVKNGDSMVYSVQIIPDNYPEIKVDEKADSSTQKMIYMLGKVGDDYGLSKLVFHYKFLNSNNPTKKGLEKNVPIKLNSDLKTQSFYYFWDLNELSIEAEDKLEYYFEVWDNDAVFGNKSSKTSKQIFAAPSIEEINKQSEKNNEKIKDDISDSKKDIGNLQKDIEELEKKLTEKRELTWEDKKKIEELLKKHENLSEQLENIVEQNEQNIQKENEFKQIDQQILDKQQEIQDLFDEVMNDEMKELLEKIEEMMQKNQKDQLMQQLEQLKLNDKDIKNQLDRMMEQLKMLQLEKKVDETVDKLNDLAEKQEKLAEQTEDKKKSNDELLKEQKKLSDEFEKAKKDLDDIKKKNQEMETPLNMDLNELKEEKENVDEQQKESEENISKNKNDKAGQNQKNAAENMKKAADKLQKEMEEATKEQHVEDYNTLRSILENLVQVSKDQEDLMNNFKQVRTYNPKYVELAQQQKKIRDDSKMIEDSLIALSKRVEQVQHFINEEIGLVNYHIDKSIKELGERNTGMVINHEQHAMTSMNNLALMLENSLDQMQEKMKSQMSGSGQCQNPGGSNPNSSGDKMKNSRQMQEGLKKQLEQMGKQQEGGQKPSSQSFGEAAAQQAAIRRRMAEIRSQLEKEGKNHGDMGKTEQMMDDLERDLYNKRLNPDVLKRQQEILTRMLEHEKALQKQEQDNKRKATEAKEEAKPIPPNIEEYLKQKQKEQELLKTVPPGLSPYYKQKVREYFEEIGG